MCAPYTRKVLHFKFDRALVHALPRKILFRFNGVRQAEHGDIDLAFHTSDD
jgi:hypothetical protein